MILPYTQMIGYNQNMVVTRSFEIKTGGSLEMLDITGQIERLVKTSGLQDGIVNIFIPGNRVGIATFEFEEGRRGNLPESLEKLNILGHEEADAQLKATLLGTSLTLPFSRSNLLLSTWQQVVLVDFGEHNRWHHVTVQMVGESSSS